MKNKSNTIENIFLLYEQHGNEDYIGEPVSQLEHMSQAAQLAMDAGCDDELILAAFFHDIGHICTSVTSENNMNGYGAMNHEKIGGEFLRECGFPQRVINLVESHVVTKRYLAFKHPNYYNSLSEASKKTLEFQGGIMNSEEATSFESNPLFAENIALRKWDEAAKEVNVPVNNLSVLKEICYRVLMKATVPK